MSLRPRSSAAFTGDPFIEEDAPGVAGICYLKTFFNNSVTLAAGSLRMRVSSSEII